MVTAQVGPEIDALYIGSYSPFDSVFRHVEEAGITPDQTAALSRVRKEFRDQLIRLFTEAANIRNEIDTIMHDFPYDADLVKGKLRRLNQVHWELNLLWLDTVDRGGRVLTAEQRDLLQNLFNQEQQLMHQLMDVPSPHQQNSLPGPGKNEDQGSVGRIPLPLRVVVPTTALAIGATTVVAGRMSRRRRLRSDK